MRKIIWWYGSILALLLIVLKVMEYAYFSYQIHLETYLGIIALFFSGLGLYIGKRVFRSPPPSSLTASQTQENPPSPSYESIGLSEREFEVLKRLAQGHSNQEIADQLFISLSTVKTHVSNIYAKLHVKRRTQAITKAKSLNIL